VPLRQESLKRLDEVPCNPINGTTGGRLSQNRDGGRSV